MSPERSEFHLALAGESASSPSVWDSPSVCPGDLPVAWAVLNTPAARWCRASPSLDLSDDPGV